jgi:hypothetical protein
MVEKLSFSAPPCMLIYLVYRTISQKVRLRQQNKIFIDRKISSLDDNIAATTINQLQDRQLKFRLLRLETSLHQV